MCLLLSRITFKALVLICKCSVTLEARSLLFRLRANSTLRLPKSLLSAKKQLTVELESIGVQPKPSLLPVLSMKATTSDFQAKMLSAVLSPTDTPMSSTKIAMVPMCPLTQLLTRPRLNAALWPPTHTCQSTLSLALSRVTLRLTLALWSFGKPNSVTSQTVPRS